MIYFHESFYSCGVSPTALHKPGPEFPKEPCFRQGGTRCGATSLEPLPRTTVIAHTVPRTWSWSCWQQSVCPAAILPIQHPSGPNRGENRKLATQNQKKQKAAGKKKSFHLLKAFLLIYVM